MEMATFEFRDGKREVPDYLSDVLRRYEAKLYQITYDEAIQLANKTMMADIVDAKLDAAVAAHFKRFSA